MTSRVAEDDVPLQDTSAEPPREGVSWWRTLVAYPVILHISVILGLLVACVQVPAIVSGSAGQRLLGSDDYVSLSADFGLFQGGLALVCAAPLGKLSDVIGRKPLLLCTIILVTLPALAYGAVGTGSVAGLFAFRVAASLGYGLTALNGVGGGPVIGAYLADALPASERTAAFSALFILVPLIAMVMLMLANMRGPAIAYCNLRGMGDQCVEEAGDTSKLAVVCLFGVIDFALILLLPKEKPRSGDEDAQKHQGWTLNPIAPLREAVKNKPLRRLCEVACIMALAESLTKSDTLYVYLNSTLRITSPEAQQRTRTLLTMAGSLSVIPVGMVAPMLLSCMGKKGLLCCMIVVAALGSACPALAAVAPSVKVAVVIGLSQGFLMAPFVPLNALVPDAAPSSEDVGSALGAVNAAQNLMNLAAGPVEAHCYNAFHDAGVGWVTYVVFGVVALFALGPAVVFQQPYVEEEWHPIAMHIGTLCEIALWGSRQTAKAVVYVSAQGCLAVASFAIVSALLGLSLLLMPLGCVGLGVLMALFGVVDCLAALDIALASWFASTGTKLLARRVQYCPGAGGVCEFLRLRLKDFKTWRSLLYFAVAKHIITVPAAIVVLGWTSQVGWLLAAPLVYSWEVETSRSWQLLFRVFGCVQDPGMGYTCGKTVVHSLQDSLAAVVLGMMVFVPGAFLAVGSAQFCAIVSNACHGAVVDEKLEALVGEAAESSYWRRSVAQPSYHRRSHSEGGIVTKGFPDTFTPSTF